MPLPFRGMPETFFKEDKESIFLKKDGKPELLIGLAHSKGFDQGDCGSCLLSSGFCLRAHLLPVALYPAGNTRLVLCSFSLPGDF